jgi:hypothetical protein
MDFIFMLTRNDMTVSDCLHVVDLVEPLGLRHIGFKDVGVTEASAGELVNRIRARGATSYMEVVSTTPQAADRSIRTAAKIGVDRVLGGQEIETAMQILHATDAGYYPFAGRPAGHPTKLAGSPEVIAEDCHRARAAGCSGVDLLAYRATDADPLDLVTAARAALDDGTLIVAGSIHSPVQIRALAAAGVDAFTIGSSAFNGSFSPDKGSLLSQLRDILAACA